MGTDDCDAILSMAASAIRNSTTGKQARDRFIFVCNKMDAQDPEKEPYENDSLILGSLKSSIGPFSNSWNLSFKTSNLLFLFWFSIYLKEL